MSCTHSMTLNFRTDYDFGLLETVVTNETHNTYMCVC